MGRHHASATTVVDAATIKALYAPLIRALMTAMRETYQQISAQNSWAPGQMFPLLHHPVLKRKNHSQMFEEGRRVL
ncbi:Protein of unknown function [Pyronema omphalodes CBS 100304]|uniref:Uncharacterized protein n=1 Tax=Pyronema omphalodes (strain CBS 100304) TaxID=1076935 RepID=U4KZ25_PYROM|nr:Protein of unknown function [Pyronema omphalodes CBS 100304]